jgi:hypothetical protein
VGRGSVDPFGSSSCSLNLLRSRRSFVCPAFVVWNKTLAGLLCRHAGKLSKVLSHWSYSDCVTQVGKVASPRVDAFAVLAGDLKE